MALSEVLMRAEALKPGHVVVVDGLEQSIIQVIPSLSGVTLVMQDGRQPVLAYDAVVSVKL